MSTIHRPLQLASTILLCQVSALLVREFARRHMLDAGQLPAVATHLSALTGIAWLGILVVPLLRQRGLSLAGVFRPVSAAWLFGGILFGFLFRGLDTALLVVTNMGLTPGTGCQQAYSPGLAVVSLVVATPIAEETIYRGLIYRAIATINRYLGSLVSALLFAALHPAISVPISFVFGLAAVWLYEQYKSLWVPIVSHAAFNLSAVLGATGVGWPYCILL